MFIKAVVSYTNKKDNTDTPTNWSGGEYEGGTASKTLMSEAEENSAKCCYMYDLVVFEKTRYQYLRRIVFLISAELGLGFQNSAHKKIYRVTFFVWYR